VEIFNKTIKNTTTKTYHYETVDELKKHLMSYLLYYNHQKKLKALKFKTPYTILLEKFDSSPELFKDNPYLKFRGLNTPQYLRFCSLPLEISLLPATCSRCLS